MTPPLFLVWVVGAGVQQRRSKGWILLVIVERPDRLAKSVEHVGITTPWTEEGIAADLAGTIRNRVEFHDT